MKKKSIIIIFIICLIVTLFSSLGTKSVKAAEKIKLYDYNTKSNFEYSGTLPKYVINGTSIDLTDTPAIVNGTGAALCNVVVFTEGCGLKYSYKKSSKKITLYNDTTKLVMYVGSKNAKLNGKDITLASAPQRYKYKASGAVCTMVPSRFVAETFGFKYNWNQSTETATIRVPINISYEGKEVKYFDVMGAVYVNGNKVNLGKYPSITIAENSMIRATAVIEKAIGADFEYDKETGDIEFSNGTNTVTMQVGSRIAYVNGVPRVAEVSPKMVYFPDTDKTFLYVPGRFTIENLGYTYKWNDSLAGCEISSSSIAKTPSTETLVKAFGKYKSTKSKIRNYTDFDTEVILSKTVTQEPVFIPLPEELTLEDVFIEQNYYKMQTTFDIDGDYTDFYSDKNNYIYRTNKDIEKITVTLVKNSNYSEDNRSSESDTSYSSLPSSNSSNTNTDEDTNDLSSDYTQEIWYDEDGNPIVYRKYSDGTVERLTLEEAGLTEDNKTESDNKEDTNKEDSNKENEKGNESGGSSENNNGDRSGLIDELGIVTYNPNKTKDFKSQYYTRITVQCSTFLEYNIDYLAEYDYISQNIQDVPKSGIYVAFARPAEIYDKIIVLDPGHGGYDPGTVHNGYQEKDMNYNIINKYLMNYFKGTDIKAYTTRSTDVLIPLYQRGMLAEILGADLFISVHHNSNSKTSVSGTSIYYSSVDTGTYGNITSKSLASQLQKALLKSLDTVDMGIIDKGFVVVRSNTVPAVLVEVGFMSNKDELKRIITAKFQKKAAKTIYNTVVKAFNSAFTE